MAANPTDPASPGIPAFTVPPALRDIADLPGPRGWPLIGNLAQLHRDRLHLDVEAWGRRYGSSFRFRLGRRVLFVISDHAALTTVLRDRPEGFRRTRHLETIAREMALPGGVFAAGGDDWRRQRRMVMAGLDPAHLAEYFASLRQVACRLQRRWQRAVEAGGEIELQPELMRYTVDAVAGLAFGTDINTLESDDTPIQQHLDQIFPALFRRAFAVLPLWRLVRLPRDRRLERSVTEVDAAIRRFIAEARARLQADPARRARPPNLLEAMIVAAEHEAASAPSSADRRTDAMAPAPSPSPSPSPLRIDDDTIAGNVLTLLLAGEDTTANTLAWMIHLLHRHPAALRRAQDEVLRHAPDAARFTPEALASLDYLEACVFETMRLKPVAPFQIVEALRDTVVAGVRVPEGAMVWCDMRTSAVAAQHFVEPQRFMPERWLPHLGAMSSTSGKPDTPDAINTIGTISTISTISTMKRISMPFGAGPRICPGRALALLEMKMAMAMLLGSFAIDHVGAPGGREPAEHMAFTMMPVGLRMRLRRRTT